MNEFTTIFETERLQVRKLHPIDIDLFFDMMSNPNVMHPVPQEVFNRAKSDEHFHRFSNSEKDSTKQVWAVTIKSQEEFIGLAAFLKNENNEDEIGYRLREKFWGIGYGTEIVKGLIDHGFRDLGIKLIVADVNTENDKSVKILEKFFEPDFEFYNENDKCTDRRYRLLKENWNSSDSCKKDHSK